jgi:hypothetical protein
MADEYTPIQTKADRRAETVEAVKDAAKDLFKGVGKAVGEATDRLVVQGRDELANALFNGNAYWPGQHPIVEPAVAESAVQEPQALSFQDVLRDAANRGGNENDRGRSR